MRKVKKQTIVKFNIDNRYANIEAKIVRKCFINNHEAIVYILRDDKNKIKISTPGKLLALSQRIADYDLCMKLYLTLLVMSTMQYSQNISLAQSNFYNLEIMITLNESSLHPSSIFQHILELILQYKEIDNIFMLLKGDRSFDYNSRMQRSIIVVFIIMNKLKL